MNANTVRLVRSVNEGLAESWSGTVAYDEATQSAQFTPQEPFGTIPLYELKLFTLTVFGDGPDRILDVDGLALNGNGDGSPGGNFTGTFAIIHNP